jgi:hypothetical protein
MKILNKEFTEGDTVEIDVKKDEITFKKMN